MTRPLDWAALQREAGRRFGVSKFRPGQRELMEAVLRGRDALGMLPTGGGKSLTYQIPALFLPRAVVVVSPLISLMQDQQEKAEAARIEVAKLDSTLSTSEERDAVEEIASGANDLIYVTPERLENPEHVAPLKERGVSLLVVDEAHCVSQWGHDFRPAYLALADAARALGRPPILALTATATPEVIDDIVRQLGMKEVEIVHTGVDRPNLFIEVRRTVNRAMKEQALLETLDRGDGSGIVYCATVRKVDELHRWLRGQGVPAGRYHGQLAASEREEMQQRFMGGELRVIVATNAFGLGIDKPDIRFVAHWNFPGSVEAWYQEAGRAGRDGKPARVTLLYRLEDKRIQSYFLGGKYPTREESQAVFRAAANARSMKALAEALELPEKRVKVIVAQLVGAGVVERRGRSLVKTGELDAEALGRMLSAYEERQTGDRERLQTMMRFAQSPLCRRRLLREYFGEERGEDCGNCDNCRSGLTRVASERPLREPDGAAS
jgi:ATP-dependent DNA helicase RecQ